MEGAEKRRREMESIIMDKVGRVIGSINEAKHVDQVIFSLHSLAILVFPLDSRAFSGPSVLFRFFFELFKF